MKSKKSHYFTLLIILCSIVYSSIILLIPAESPTSWGHIIPFIVYVAIPVISAWIVDRDSIQSFIKKYLCFNKAQLIKTISYCLFTSISFGLSMIFIIYLFGNIFDIIGVHLVKSIPGNFLSIDITNINPFFRIIILWIFILFGGVAIGILNTITEEIGWRGFMHDNLNCSQFIKPIYIGLVWSVWSIPFILKSEVTLIIVLTTVLYNVIFSFYLAKIKNDTDSVWCCASVRGIINATFLIILFTGGTQSEIKIITMIALMIITFISYFLFRHKKV